MRRITVAALKGGSGKTVSALSLAASFAERGRSVLLLDLDAQGTLSAWLGADPDLPSVLDVMTGAASVVEATQTTDVPGVELVPFSPALAGLDRRWSHEPGAESILRGALDVLRVRGPDVLVIDTPPGLHLATLSAFVAAPEIVAAVVPDPSSLRGLAELRDTVQRVRERLRSDVDLRHVLPCNVPRTRLAREVLDTLRASFQREILPQIRSSARVPECFALGLSILDHDPEGRAATDYREAAAALLARSPRRKAKK